MASLELLGGEKTDKKPVENISTFTGLRWECQWAENNRLIIQGPNHSHSPNSTPTTASVKHFEGKSIHMFYLSKSTNTKI